MNPYDQLVNQWLHLVRCGELLSVTVRRNGRTVLHLEGCPPVPEPNVVGPPPVEEAASAPPQPAPAPSVSVPVPVPEPPHVNGKAEGEHIQGLAERAGRREALFGVNGKAASKGTLPASPTGNVETDILQALAEVGPGAGLSVEQLAARAGYDVDDAFGNAVMALARRGKIVRAPQGFRLAR
jgi:hypothetical protein